MKIDGRYELRVCLVDCNNGRPGGVYTSFEKFKAEHPYSGYRFGFYVFDRKTAAIPSSCNDWNDSPEEAMMDYFENCIGEDYRTIVQGAEDE